MSGLIPQLINLFASVILILAFAMLSQRRILSLIYLYTWQGLAVVGSTTVVAYVTNQHHLYYSASLTFILKVILIPYMLYRLIARLNVRWDIETLVNIPTLMIVGIVLVIFAFNVALPISSAQGRAFEMAITALQDQAGMPEHLRGDSDGRTGLEQLGGAVMP